MMTTDLAAAKAALAGMCGGQTPVLCAVSGGLDSMCLLHLLTHWGRERGITVTAAHFNHRLRGAEADRDETFVRTWCEANAVPFVCGGADVAAFAAEAGLSVEEAARTLRYAFLEEQKQALDCTFILTAHHADDNAETMLLNLLRGTGGRGLAGIPETRGAIVRPLLGVTREELAAYAAEHGIPHVEDGTNALDDAARNVLRHHVLPVLRQLNPRAVENMSRAAALLERDEAALGRMAEDLLRAACRRSEEEITLDAEVCAGAEDAVVSRAVLMLLEQTALHRRDWNHRHVEAVCGLLSAAPGKTLSLPYGLSVRREATTLVLKSTKQRPAAVPIRVGETVDFGRWRVTLSREGGDRALALSVDGELSVTAWERDDRMTLPGSRGSRSFKRLCADLGISPEKRDTLPVLRCGKQAAAAPVVGIDTSFSPRGDAEHLIFLTFRQEEEKDHEK